MIGNLFFYKALEKINRALDDKFSLVLVVSQDSRLLKELSHRMYQTGHYHYVDINSALSDFLVETKNQFDANIVQNWFMEFIKSKNKDPGLVLCSGVDLLFSPQLHLDPLKLFNLVCRYVPLVVFWPGLYQTGKLTYAVPQHHHYREWSSIDQNIFIIHLNE